MSQRFRVIVDNDFSGDPDDLIQLSHHLLARSVEVVAIIGSHLCVGDVFDDSERQADNAVEKANELLGVMGKVGSVPVFAGSNVGLADSRTPLPSAASEAIIREARRDDPRPLFIACGGGLTDLASAMLEAPDIVDRITVLWIGGPEYPGVADVPPGITGAEYNLNIDILAARAVLSESAVEFWQIPRNAYRQCLMSQAELRTRVKPAGALGAYLYENIRAVVEKVETAGRPMGDTYCLGDSPLVLLTALQTSFEPTPASSDYTDRTAHWINDDGSYGDPMNGRTVRVYDRIDTRLMFEDFFALLGEFATEWSGTPAA
jgi:inosine-uridine nucleoside N-ribohydrolase